MAGMLRFLIECPSMKLEAAKALPSYTHMRIGTVTRSLAETAATMAQPLLGGDRGCCV
jgi:hypothetical protein